MGIRQPFAFTIALALAAPMVAAAAPYAARDLRVIKEVESDAARFKEAAKDYGKTLNSMIKRAYDGRRRDLLATFEKKIREQEQEERTRRIAAITLFEDFLRRYPNDSRWTPDVIFRLAELYFEKSNDAYLQASDQYEKDLIRFDRGELAQAPAPPKHDYTQTIELHRRLIQQFPDYRLIDGAYYLLGFCMTEMEREVAGTQAFLSLVCANKHEPPLDQDLSEPAPIQTRQQPAVTTSGELPALRTGTYDDCKPLDPKSRFNAESWVRIGEQHFDANELGPAISAYQRVIDLGTEDNAYYDEALYKLAWTYYRADEFMQAIKRFDELVAYADAEYARTGRYGSEMRPEAIQYLAVSFSEEDWDGDTLPDERTGFERIEEFYRDRKDEKHVYEVYKRLADIYFDTVKYDDAVAIYKLILERWPYSARNPEVQDKIIVALERQRKFDEAIAEREEFTRLFGKGSEWERRNLDNAKALKRARTLDEQALIQAAVFHHKAGQDLKKRGVAMSDVSLLRQASEEYAVAAKAYKRYLERFPATKNSYEIRYSLASCLFYSERFKEAADVFAHVRDSNLDDRFREEAAFSAAKSWETYIGREVAGDGLAEPELPSAKKPPESLDPLPIPEPYQRWQEALDAYTRTLPNSPKTPRLAYKAAEIPFRFRHFDEARERFEVVYSRYCNTEVAANSAQAVLVSYQLEENLDRMEEWANKLQTGKCVPRGAGKSDELIAGSKLLLEGIKFTRARELQDKADTLAEAGRFEEAAPLYDQAAAGYLALVDASPKSQDADKALNNAAVAYEKSRRFESATRIYERLWQQYPDSPLAGEAIWRAAVNYQRFFEFDKAVQNYLILADSPKFEDSEHRELAVYNAATILENDQAYSRSAELFLRYARNAADPADAARAYFQAGLIHKKMNNFRRMEEIFRAFPSKYGDVPGQAARSVEGLFHIADAAADRGDERTAQRYYQMTISAFERSGEPAGSDAAEYAAHAAFELAEVKLEGFLEKELRGSLAVVDRQRKRMAEEAVELKNTYEEIWDYKRARWTLAAMYRAGAIMEHFAKSVAAGFRNAPVPRKAKRLGQEAVDLYLEALDQKLAKVVRPLEEQAKQLYVSCVERARELGVSNRYTEAALERLNAFDPVEYPVLKRARVEMVVE